jgi:catalase
VYVKWHLKPEGGIETLESDTAARLAGTQPDYHVQDLFDSIERGDHPKWLVYVQVMTPEQAQSAPIDIFDDTYTWPQKQYPLRLVGRMTLDKNVSDAKPKSVWFVG